MKKYFAFLLILLVIFMFANSSLSATNFPDKEVKLVVIVAAGGGSDMTMRALAKASEPYLGEPIVVVNKPGAGGGVALAQGANAKPDGYTATMIAEALYTLPMVTPNLSFDENDYKPVITVNFDPAALVISAGSDFDTVNDLLDYAKANPGVVTLGNSGYGNIWHLSATAFERKAGVKFNQVPFAGAAPTITATLGGHIDAMVASAPEVASQVEAGKLKILAIMGEKRDPNFPNVPTMKESGYDLVIGTWRGVGVPSSTPDKIVNILHNAFKKGMESDTFKNFMREQGLGVLYRGSEETAAYIKNDKPRFRSLLEDIGIIK